ncbi:MAG: arsenosugar biosynthesis radical SAM protein ArsS [Gammaproteobacteria bacterium]|nr:arsenosugar biosynthesis radical SAM protein ArsS [Gammaproteobacteria bacterium]
MDASVRHDFQETLKRHGAFPLRRGAPDELQVNLGYLCNQACEHCHVEAGPKRTEIMTRATMEKILAWAAQNGIARADLTGGAPELIPGFRDFVDGLLELGIAVTSRCNLTVLFEPGQNDLAKWYAARGVRLVCSLPCYTAENVEAQRGKGVFGKSIQALQLLNAEGYGRRDNLRLDLVYNPLGPSLPPPQAALESDYKTRLKADFGVDFNSLLTLTNLPVKRFEHFLRRTGQLDGYMQLLADNFNPDTVEPLMCRHLLSVDWRGYIYDCDFNQMLELPAGASGRRLLWEISRAELEGAPIALGSHCFGCTAGAGSSCGGALA